MPSFIIETYVLKAPLNESNHVHVTGGLVTANSVILWEQVASVPPFYFYPNIMLSNGQITLLNRG